MNNSQEQKSQAQGRAKGPGARLRSYRESYRGWRARHRYIPFVAVALISLLMIFVFSDHNLLQTYKRSKRISGLKKELRRARESYRQDSIRLEEIRSNKDGVEQIARERFMMKAPDEQVFLVEDKPNEKDKGQSQ
ncbi:FtsB family cell division protein [Porphyromonas crevioricanis]|uniref:FtsB family cell division protein n=1 Tax=Porphyromonas crevioricanis TaxID=393921 RepID=UPI00040D469C|nr:septum formation initiator family protein [Porphyromonas crevioricanis]SKA02515.1 Septum formation initiator [Porphyromonas crevioricanis]